jgi:hypothetical protein
MKQAALEEFDGDGDGDRGRRMDKFGGLQSSVLHDQIRYVGERMGDGESVTEAFEKYGDDWKEERAGGSA